MDSPLPHYIFKVQDLDPRFLPHKSRVQKDESATGGFAWFPNSAVTAVSEGIQEVTKKVPYEKFGDFNLMMINS